jgi:hypothetical protein
MNAGPTYTELGTVLDELARARNVRGPHRIARYIQDKMGEGIGGSAWQQIFVGSTKTPERKNIQLFADAFDLTPEERARLAWAYTYGAY